MSYETRKPNIKIIMGDDWFNILISALKKNTEISFDEQLVKQANYLMEKLLKYSRPYENEDGKNCADIRFFPNEASEMIWQLLVRCNYHMDELANFYLELEKNHVPKTEKNKTK